MPPSGILRAGAVIAALAALLIAAGAVVPRWWSSDTESLDMGVGLRRVELCGSLGCASRALDDLGGTSPSWPKLGRFTFATSWFAAALLLAAALSVLARGSRAAVWRRRIGRTAAAVSLFAIAIGAAFTWTYPGFEGLGVGWALLAYLGGSILGVGSAGILIAGATDPARAPS